MQRPCDLCGASYEALRPTSKFCSARCRQRKSRGATATPAVTESETGPVTEGDTAPVVPLNALPVQAAGPVESALLSELSSVEREDSSLGQAALALARRVDIGRDMGAGLAALVKQMEATAKAAVADVKSAASPLDRMRDELAERRSRGA